MFDFVRRYPFFRRLIIAVFALPLMFAGGSFIGSLAQQQSVGVVGELDIPLNEFYAYYQNYVEDYRRRYEVEEITQPVAEQIVAEVQRTLGSRYLVESAIHQMGISAPDKAVADAIRDNPEFHNEGGEFDLTLYEDLVHDRRRYEEQVRAEQNRLPLLFVMGSYSNPQLREILATFRRQERVVDEASIPLDAIATSVTVAISPEEVNLYYQRNNAEYAIEELGVFEYFTVALDDYVDASVSVSEDDIQFRYEEYLSEQQIFERRRVSHIYVSDEAQAGSIYESLADNEDAFAETARAESEDSGTAAFGGELGIFVVGDLPEDMEAVVLTLAAGEVAPPLAVDGGYSILKVDEIINEQVQTLDELRDELALQVRRDEAFGDFDDVVQQLNELAPLELGSLANMAAEVSASIGTVQISNENISSNPAPFDDETMLLEVFDSYVVTEGENSLGIPLDENEDIFLYTRVLQYRPAGVEPLEVVAPAIEAQLRAERVLELVAADDSVVAPLLATIAWTATHTVNLANDSDDSIGENAIDNAGEAASGENSSGASDDEGGLEDATIDLIFTTDLSDGLPAYTYEAQENAIQVFRTREIFDNEAQLADYEVIDQLTETLVSRLSFNAFLALQHDLYDIHFDDAESILAAGQFGSGAPQQ